LKFGLGTTDTVVDASVVIVEAVFLSSMAVQWEDPEGQVVHQSETLYCSDMEKQLVQHPRLGINHDVGTTGSNVDIFCSTLVVAEVCSVAVEASELVTVVIGILDDVVTTSLFVVAMGVVVGFIWDVVVVIWSVVDIGSVYVVVCSYVILVASETKHNISLKVRWM